MKWTRLGAIVAVMVIGAIWLVAQLTTNQEQTHPSTQTAAQSIEACASGTPPKEAAEVIRAIQAGGPFAYPDNDGVTFGNYEHQLPEKPKGFYFEYTVKTPNVQHRGARRIVTGGTQPTNPEIWYYTADHYDSFCTFKN